MKKYLAVYFLFCATSFLSCSGSGGYPSDNTTNNENSSYILSTGTSSTISPEYTTYNYVVNTGTYEKRNIMVKGKISNTQDNAGNLLYDIPYIWDQNNCMAYFRVINNPLKGSENYYNRNTNEFVIPFNYQCNNSFDHTLMIVGGTDNCSSTERQICTGNVRIHVVQDRKMKIHYNYMEHYNILYDNNVGNDGLSSLTSAFGEANTKIEIINENKNTTVQDADLPLGVATWSNDLYNELTLRNLIPQGFNMPNMSVWLIGLKNYTVSSGDLAPMGGYTLITSNSWGRLFAASCIFVDKVKTKYPSNTDKQKKFVSVVTCHELGHCRAMELTAENPYTFVYGNSQYTFGNLTNEDHTGGHNGKNKDSCVMSYGIADKQIEGIHFCSGHLQMLFNCSSQDGGY